MADDQIGITFHGIGQNFRTLESGEERYWLSRDAFLRTLDLIASQPDPDRILLTFDDGNLSDHDIALPALLERGLTGSFFVITGRIDVKGSLNCAQMRALADSGMTIGSHGIDHVDWRKVGPERLRSELLKSKHLLEDALGREISTAAIPFGRYNQRVLTGLRAAGYNRVFSSDGGLSREGCFLVGRTNIHANTTPKRLSQLLSARESGFARLVRGLKALRRKIA